MGINVKIPRSRSRGCSFQINYCHFQISVIFTHLLLSIHWRVVAFFFFPFSMWQCNGLFSLVLYTYYTKFVCHLSAGNCTGCKIHLQEANQRRCFEPGHQRCSCEISCTFHIPVLKALIRHAWYTYSPVVCIMQHKATSWSPTLHPCLRAQYRISWVLLRLKIVLQWGDFSLHRSTSWWLPATVWVQERQQCWLSYCAACTPHCAAMPSLHQGACWGDSSVCSYHTYMLWG